MAKFKDQSQGKNIPGTVLRFERQGHKFFFHCQETVLCVSVFSDRVVRFRYANYGYFENDFSYAVEDTERCKAKHLDFLEQRHQYSIITQYLTVIINRQNLGIIILDGAGNVVLEDELGYHWEDHKAKGGNIVICTKKLQSGESFYGLGDKPQRLNLRGQRLQLWGSDTYGFTAETDPIYKNIPFFMGLHHRIGYGIFFDNSFRSYFDFGQERQNVFSFWAQGGEMNYYFIYGPELLSVSQEYTWLTGRPELPPMWSLGYQQSKWSYFPEKVVKDLAKNFREKQIPCDVVHIDIDYMDGFRCFTWDKEHFPDPGRMIKELDQEGFKTVVILDPGIKIDKDYFVWEQAFEQDFFCKRADGALFRGSVWPGLCHFPDFTHPDVRTWWAGLFKDFLKTGIAGVWNDMNEPAVFEEGTFPEDVRHDYDGNPCSHRKGHNVYGTQMVRATYEGLKAHRPKHRPFALARSIYAGAQRYSAVWTGDNIASWDHLEIANIMCQRLSISGISFVGTDVGGFIETPDAELYIRWLQLGLFHPFFRTHSSGDHGDQEPWSFGEEHLPTIRKVIEFRYVLLPYLYTAFWQHVTEGVPFLRPLFMIDQNDPETYMRLSEFGCGDHLLACPIDKPGVDGRWMYLPQGDWYLFWNNQRYSGSGEEVWVGVTMETFPLLVKAGAVLPLGPVMQYVGQIKPEKLELRVYYSGANTVESQLYVDEGEGYGYQKKQYSVSTFTTSGTENEMRISQKTEGKYSPDYTYYELKLIGLPFEVKECLYKGEGIRFEMQEDGTVLVPIGVDFDELLIKA